MKRLIFSIISLLLATTFAVSSAERKLSSYERYISKYSDLARDHQKRFGIPASITLAQGLLESGAGLSKLARESNNHFGIKCHADWKGDRVYHDDDAIGECFRKYDHVEDSYEDHSHFLADRKRYASLFQLRKNDYVGWAKGLQQCGYATDKAYANKLIKVIEDYELYQFDSSANAKLKHHAKKIEQEQASIMRYTIYRTYDMLYVYANGIDNIDVIAQSLGFKTKDLCKYNEIPEDYPLQRGDIIWLQKKKKKADIPNFNHTVQVGESMHSISQMYGIRMKNLYKMNKKDYDYIPTEGDVLKLR